MAFPPLHSSALSDRVFALYKNNAGVFHDFFNRRSFLPGRTIVSLAVGKC